MFADYSSHMMIQKLKERHLIPTNIRMILEETPHLLSSTTTYTLLSSLANCFANQSSLSDLLNPYLLNPPGPSTQQPITPLPLHGEESTPYLAYDNFLPGYDAAIKTWTYPAISQLWNTRIVNRTNA